MPADTLNFIEPLSALVEGCKRFDRKSQQLLYKRYYGFSLKTAFRYLDTYEQAVDAVHHSFLKVFRGFSSFEVEQKDKLELSLTRWARRIVAETVVSSLLPDLFVCTAGSRPQPMEELLAHDRQEDDCWRLIDALRRLPLVYRTVFNLYVIDEYPHEEIAALLGITVQVSELFVYEARVLLGGMDTRSPHIHGNGRHKQ